MYLVAGLGNPGLKYKHTRHNVGFDTITYIADRYRINMDMKKFRGVAGTGFIEGQKVMLLKPQTYMNLSGESIGEAASFFKLEPSQVIVICDDIALAPGSIRIRLKGSSGGHNGLKNIIEHLGTEGFPRVRVGVGGKPENWDLKDHVLGHYSREEAALVEEAIINAADAVRLIVAGSPSEAMNLYNRKQSENKTQGQEAPGR